MNKIYESKSGASIIQHRVLDTGTDVFVASKYSVDKFSGDKAEGIRNMVANNSDRYTYKGETGLYDL